MSCTPSLFLFYDLTGQPTGEYGYRCSGTCPQGECTTIIDRSADGRSQKIRCVCVNAQGKEIPRTGCFVELHIEMIPGGKVQMTPVCCPHPCGTCKECSLRSSDRTLEFLGMPSERSWVRQVREFRCECRAVDSPAVRRFYEDKICRLVAFAVNHGCDVSKQDLFHAHLISDMGPPCRDASGGWIIDEQFMMDHYGGLVAHAHEFDTLRSTTEDNFNIVVEPNGAVHFAGSTTTVYAGDHRVPKGPWPETIYFRICKPGKACPPCTSKIHCPAINADLCVGLRRRFPPKDPALGVP